MSFDFALPVAPAPTEKVALPRLLLPANSSSVPSHWFASSSGQLTSTFVFDFLFTVAVPPTTSAPVRSHSASKRSWGSRIAVSKLVIALELIPLGAADQAVVAVVAVERVVALEAGEQVVAGVAVEEVALGVAGERSRSRCRR